MINFPAVYRKLYKHLDTYSGSKFIKTVQANDPVLPDYNVYIEERRKSGKSTIRKDYFKDILFSYPEITRIRLFEMFLKEYEETNPEDARTIKSMLEV